MSERLRPDSPGYYWVRLKYEEGSEPAKFTGDEYSSMLTLGSDVTDPADLIEIGPKIEFPGQGSEMVRKAGRAGGIARRRCSRRPLSAVHTRWNRTCFGDVSTFAPAGSLRGTHDTKVR